MDLKRNPFMYSTKTDKTITEHEFDKVLLKLELDYWVVKE